jgi:hypothetical protein
MDKYGTEEKIDPIEECENGQKKSESIFVEYLVFGKKYGKYKNS